jgi:hypothetical protein
VILENVMRRALVVSLLNLVLFVGSALAQTKTGTTIAQFVGIEPSARHAAMGNAGAGLAEGIESIYFNPGVAGTLSRPAIQFTHSNWFADISFDYAAVAYPLQGFGTLFGSVTALNSGEIDVRTVERPLGTGERYTVADVALSLGFGRQITSRFAAGLQLNYLHERIWHSTMNTFTVSAGTIYQLTDSGMKIGFSLSHLGTEGRFSGRDLAIQYDNNPDEYGDNSALPGEQLTDEFPVPILFRLGLSLPYEISENNRILFLVDGLHPNDNTESLNLGTEWVLQNVLALRAGYQTLFQEDSELGLTFGLGIQLAGGRVNTSYAWADHDHLGATHRITLVLGL